MRLANIHPGDIIRADWNGQRYYAKVVERVEIPRWQKTGTVRRLLRVESKRGVHPGGADAQPTGTPDPQGPGSATNPAAPSACDGGSPEGPSQASGESARLFEPEPKRPLSAFTDAEAA